MVEDIDDIGDDAEATDVDALQGAVFRFSWQVLQSRKIPWFELETR